MMMLNSRGTEKTVGSFHGGCGFFYSHHGKSAIRACSKIRFEMVRFRVNDGNIFVANEFFFILKDI